MVHAAEGAGQRAQGSVSLDGELLAALYVFAAALTSYEVAHADELPAGFAGGVKEALQQELLARWRHRLASGEIRFAPVMRKAEIAATVKGFRELGTALRSLGEKLQGESEPATWQLAQAAMQAAELAERIAALAAASHPART
jgi:hypothetical protein